jgi:Uma2 family endonuclease
MLQVYQSLPEGALAQLINNQIIMSPAPTDNHQKIPGLIFARLFNYVDQNSLGEVRTAPYDVHLGNKNIFQPDILFIAAENRKKIKEEGVYGAPDIVVENLLQHTTMIMGKKKMFMKSMA